VFLYVLQFVLMPVIARQYWASLFVGNSLYLLAGGYYTVITFLGYNGEFPLSSLLVVVRGECGLIACYSFTVPEAHGTATSAHGCTHYLVYRQPLWVQHAAALRACVMGRHRRTTLGMTSERMHSCFSSDHQQHCG
jgi:hypothetical protein